MAAPTAAALSAEEKKLKRAQRRAKARLRRRERAVAHGKEILAAASKGGYVSSVPKTFVGKGDYRPKNRAQVMQLRGKGDLVGDVADMGGALVGKGIRWLGDRASGFVKNLFGIGDYRTNEMPERNTLIGGDVPYINAGGKGKNGSLPTVIRHKEMVSTITSSASFQCASYALQPGLPTTFPWLSGMASLYQRYRIRGCVVEFVSLVNSYGGADVNGPVVLSARYDTSTPAPVNVQEACNSEFAVAGNPMTNLLMAVECDPKMVPVNVLEVRTGAVPSGRDQQMFDHCIIDVTNSGQADSSVTIGQLWITYEIELELPIDVDITNGAVLSDHFQLSGIDNTHWLGTTQTAVSTSTLGGKCTSTTYTFPSYVTAGEWLVVWCGAASSIGGVTKVASATNATLLTMFSNTTVPDGWNSPGAFGSLSAVNATIVNITGPSAVLTFATASGTIITALGDLVVTPFNGNIVTLMRDKRRWAKYWKQLDDERAQEEERFKGFVSRMLGPRAIECKEDVPPLRLPPCKLHAEEPESEEEKGTVRKRRPRDGEESDGSLVSVRSRSIPAR